MPAADTFEYYGHAGNLCIGNCVCKIKDYLQYFFARQTALALHPGPLVFVNCTGRKRRPATAYLRARDLHFGSAQTIATRWVEQLRRAPLQCLAQQLYCGRSVTDALSATEALQGTLYFVSAGLGVVAGNATVPAYNLTVAPSSPESVLPRITKGPSASGCWWNALTTALGTPSPVAAIVGSSSGLVLVAVPSTYLDMLADELAALPTPSLRRLRIMGPRDGGTLPARLRDQWMPYDRRLHAQEGFAGTESDFPQRALRHFALHVIGADPKGSASDHATVVDRLLGTRRVERRTPGRRMSDEEITAVMWRIWDAQGGNRSRILRELRSTLRVACEQSRFKRLADQLEDKKRAAHSA